MNELSNFLHNTLSQNRDERKKAELYIKSVESQPSYSLYLLHILQDDSIKLPTRLAAAVTFKNFIKRFWPCSQGDEDKITAEDRDGVRNQLIGVLLSVSGNMQQQLSEAISTIWREDFPNKWPNIIPELVQRMAHLGADLSMVQGVLYTAFSLFKRYRHECASQDLYREMKLVIKQFGSPLLELAKNLLPMVVDKTQTVIDASRFLSIFRCLLLVCKIFYCLNCQDLPEFFEDTIADWMTFFHNLLEFDLTNVQATFPTDTNVEEIELVIDQTKSQICDNTGLYASKYEEEFAPYLPGFVTDVWEMLLRTSEQTKFDMLIGNAIGFLSTVISKPQHRYLFENPEILQKLCEKVILPNMHFRAQDEELFTENPEEYMRLDMDGSNAQTRRRATCHLVHVLCQAFEGPVISNFSTYINHLLMEYANFPDGSTWVSKDAALLLVTSVASRGKTQKHGVTTSTELVNLTEFFEMHVLPELQNVNVNHLPVIKSDCLRYAITFRTLLPPASLVVLLNLMPSLLSSTVPVVHSYAAILIDKFLSMKRPDSQTEPLISKDQIANPHLLIQKLLSLLQSDSENVFVIRALLRTCCSLQELTLQFMSSIVTVILACINQVAKNPSKPDFNHYLFETICLCIRLTCAADASAIVQFEGVLFPIFQDILQQDIVEFVPYVFQLLSVMLEQYPLSPSVLVNIGESPTVNGSSGNDGGSLTRPSPPYSALLSRLLVPSLWDPVKNVPSLVRLVQSYLLHGLDDLLSSNKLSPILGVFQKLVTSASNDVHSFNLLLAVIIAMPKEIMSGYLRQVFMVIFKRLQSHKSEKFMKSFASFIAHFVIIYSPNALIELIDGIQTQLFVRVLEKVLLPYAEVVISTPTLFSVLGGGKYLDDSGMPIPLACTHWRQTSIGLIKLICEADAIHQPTAVYHVSWAPLVVRIIAGLAAGPGGGGDAAIQVALSKTVTHIHKGLSNDERFIEVETGESATSNAYSQLSFAIQCLPDLCKNVIDPRLFLVQNLQHLYYLYPNILANELKTVLSPEQTMILQSHMQRAVQSTVQ